MAAVLTEPDAVKAVTTGAPADMIHFSFPISKHKNTEAVNPVDGTPDIEIWGKVTDGTLDSDLQIVDPQWSLAALKTWFDTKANVRFAHDPKRPIGKGIELDGHYVRALIAEPVAKHLIRTKVLNDWSVGIINPDIRKGDPRFRHLDPMGKAIHGIITGREDGLSQIGEVSTCDRGSNYGTSFQIAKSAGDGSLELTDSLTAPDEVLAKVAAPKTYKTVSVDLPASMRIKVSPAQLAKMNTLARRAVVPDVIKVAEPAPDQTAAAAAIPPADDADDALKAVMAAEAAVYKRDIDTATRHRLASEGHALPNLSYPIENEGDLENAATLARSGHGDVTAARRLIGRESRRLKVPNPLKRKPRAAKAVPGTADVIAKKKSRVMCGHCGARQNSKHVHCPECGNKLMPGAMPLTKNHDFTCLKCGATPLDKGEPHCPQCGTANPGYLPEADRKIPANIEAAKAAAKERVNPPASVTKAGKGKKAKGKKGNPFGDKQAPAFGKDEPDAKDDADAKKAAVTKGKRGKKKGGKGRSPAIGDVAQSTTGLPPHREPDGPPVEAFEADLGASDGDMEMKAAMRHKALGIEPALAALHDLTCPAFRPADVTKALPWASFAAIDTESFQRAALDAATGTGMASAMDAWNKAAALSRCAVTLKTADAQVLHDLRLTNHAAFVTANADLLKTFRDATPGPGSFPTPGHPMPGQFRRPYLSGGHGAASPQHDGPHSFPVTEGTPVAADYQRGYLTEGHATDSPANSTPRPMPQPAPTEAGRPESMHYQGTMADNNRQSLLAMHDHVSRRFPDVCPMSPDIGHVQKPGRPVPEAVGGPVAGKTAKPGKAKAGKAAKAKAAATRRKLERKVLKGVMSVEDARAKLGLQPAVAKAAAPPETGPAVDAEAITAAVKAATAPLLKRQRAQDKRLRQVSRVADAIADQSDTSAAPYRGSGASKSATMTSPAPAGPVTAAQSAEQAQTAKMRRLYGEWRTATIPEHQEAAWNELQAMLGTNPLTGYGDGLVPLRQRPPTMT